MFEVQSTNLAVRLLYSSTHKSEIVHPSIQNRTSKIVNSKTTC
jgi:hypothetical protein